MTHDAEMAHEEFEDVVRDGARVKSEQARRKATQILRHCDGLGLAWPGTGDDIADLAKLRADAQVAHPFLSFEAARASEIRPALTDEQWRKREYQSDGANGCSIMLSDFGLSVVQSGPITNPDDLVALIALANAALPNEDPRKLRPETVERLRAIVVDDPRDDGGFFDDELVEEHSDAISSYLPRERP